MLVVMHLTLSPVLRLVVQNICVGIQGFIAGTVQDTAGVPGQGRHQIADLTVVVEQGLPVIVPVDGHGQGIAQKEAPQGTGGTVG